jgi:uncharacterized protein involved in exopolysaccharide biosynthesis
MFDKFLKNPENNGNDLKEELTFSTFFQYLSRKRRSLFLIVLITVIVVMVYSLIAPFQYRSTATILPPENSRGMGDLTSFLQTLSGGVALGGGAGGNKLLIFKEILKSREVAKIIVEKNNLVEKLDVEPDKIYDLYDIISKMIQVELKRSGLIVLTVETATPFFPNAKEKEQASALSAAIANTAVNALDSINRVKNTTKARKKREFTERVFLKKQHELFQVDSLLEQFMSDHHLYALEDQNKAIMNNAVELGTRLAQAEIELNLKRLDFSESSPVVISAQEKYNNLLEQYKRIQTGGIASQDKFSIPLDSVPRLIRIYQDLMRKKKILEQVNLYLATQKYQSAIQEASDVPTVEPLDLAIVPEHRIAPQRKVMLILAFFISLVGGSLYLLILAVYNGNLIVKKEEKEGKV